MDLVWYQTYVDHMWITADGKHVKRGEIYHNGKSYDTPFAYKIKERIWNEEDYSGYGTNRYYKVCGHLVHRLAASAKNGGYKFNKGDCVDHIDCDHHNNSFSNLKICSYSENMQNPITKEHLGKRCWIYKDDTNKFIRSDQLEYYLANGWKRGSISRITPEGRERMRQYMINLNKTRTKNN